MTDWTKGIPEPDKPDTTDQTAPESPETTGSSADTADSPQGGSAAPFGAVDWTKHPSTATPAAAASEPAPSSSTPGSTPTDPRSTTPGTSRTKTTKTAVFSRTARLSTQRKPTTSTTASQPQEATPPGSQRRKSLMIFGSLAAACVLAIVGAIVIVDTTGGDDGADGADSSDTANTANGAGGEQVDMHNTADTTQGPDQNSDQAPAGSAEDPDPDPNAPAVSGTCAASQDEVQVAASPNSPRGVIAEFEKQYFAGNAKAIPGLLTGDSSMQDNDWVKVLDQVADGSEYCLRMNPVAENSGGRVALELAITTDGERTVYRQIAETTSVTSRPDSNRADSADSSDTTRWFIKEIRKAS